MVSWCEALLGVDWRLTSDDFEAHVGNVARRSTRGGQETATATLRGAAPEVAKAFKAFTHGCVSIFFAYYIYTHVPLGIHKSKSVLAQEHLK